MTSVNVREYRNGDLQAFDPRRISLPKKEVEDRISSLYAHSACSAYTILLGDKPIAVYGISQLWNGVAEIWSFMDDQVRRVPLGITKVAKFLIRDHQKRDRLHRIQMIVAADHAEAQGWAQTLGFHKEAVLSAYGPDRSDQFMFARCF